MNCPSSEVDKRLQDRFIIEAIVYNQDDIEVLVRERFCDDIKHNYRNTKIHKKIKNTLSSKHFK